ncbi:hypothetical protein O181_027038 [Austropuccinia psidii MF-1]|uniref:Uncharacterized protein n=1 Tax=Austropuccinia psidii MF-1 TaxID=1389203 RepID=A0A9Q3CNR1_9BASI|nr:hypothetical protein [Austropuccinia psidii MF-1]
MPQLLRLYEAARREFGAKSRSLRPSLFQLRSRSGFDGHSTPNRSRNVQGAKELCAIFIQIGRIDCSFKRISPALIRIFKSTDPVPTGGSQPDPDGLGTRSESMP